MNFLAEMREQRRLDRVAEAELNERHQDAAAKREQEQREAEQRRKAARRADRRARREQVMASLPDLGMSALWATLIVLPIALAWAAQAAFAVTDLGISEPWNHAFPASIETGAWLCAFEAHRRIRRRLSVGSLRRWMWILASVAAVINASHGFAKHGLSAGLALGALSLLGITLHSIRQGLDRDASAAMPAGLRMLRVLRYPRLSFRAASLRAARELDRHTAWRLAWLDRYGVGPDAPRRAREVATVIVQRETTEALEAAKRGELTLIDGQIHRGFAGEVRQILDARQRAELMASTHPNTGRSTKGAHQLAGPNQTPVLPESETAESPDEQQELSARAAEVLPLLRVAIATGEVRPNPPVRAIRTWLRDTHGESLGVPAAQELRDAVACVRPVNAVSEHSEQEAA